jgi:hypothetical protein
VPIPAQNTVGDATLTSTLLNGEATEMTLSVDPIDAGVDLLGPLRLAMLDDDAAENPNLIGVGRTLLHPVSGVFTSIRAASRADLTFSGEQRLDVRNDLLPGTAFVIDSFGGQDFLALVVDRSLRVEGRCTDLAMVTLDLEPIDGFQ